MTSLLLLSGITKSFDAVRALKDVSFSLKPGEVHALLGENGAGKSTLIRIITGAHQPDGGSIEISGHVIRNLSPAGARKLGISAIYQQPALFPDLSVTENIALGMEAPLAWRRIRRAERRERASNLLRGVGARIDPDSDVRSLSMPQQQLVEIAKALGAGARILIMDEPTASLTETEVELLFSVVRELRRDGVGIIYISHRLEEIFSLADRVTVLRDGESVGTSNISAIDEAALIRAMVGRDVATIFPPPEGEPKEVMLSVRGVSCRASGIDQVTFDIRAGEVLGLAGLVGAGRTELARILFGITPADSGEILLFGRPVTIHSPRDAIAHGIAYVPEDRRRHGIILELPIAHNVTLAIHNRLFPWAWLRFRRENQLAWSYIRELDVRTQDPGAPGGTLSGGNQQKIALARWLASEPKLLILDEPTQGVDIGAKSEIHKIIRRLAAKGLAILMISSDLPEILGMSARIAVMRAGKVVRILEGDSADAHSVMAAALGQISSGESS